MRKCIAMLCFALCAVSHGQERLSMNKGWDFMRLTGEQMQGEPRSQGSDWSSQYNVQHVESKNNALAIHPDTLRKEAARLSGGKWESVRLPHTAYVEPLVIVHPWQGVCYYRKRFNVEERWAGKELWLEFEGAMHLADVWVNGQHAVQHAGGYTPFVVNLTDWVKAGKACEILVRLDNRDNPLIPPGKALSELDFCYHSGLYRDVHLIVKDPVHITHPIMADTVAGGGVFVSYPEVTAKRARIAIKTQVENNSQAARQLTLRHVLYEWRPGKGRGKKVVEGEEPLRLAASHSTHRQQELVVEQPRLWSPGSPALYLLRTELRENGKLIDSEETRIGLRRIEMSREKGFLINGSPLWLNGTNRHQEYPYVGNALSDRAQYRDMYQIRQMGYNCVRLGHYLQDPSVLDACDELGLLVIEPIPGWQFFNNNEVFKQGTYRDIRDMIRRDRNHPCVLAWETTLNESWPSNEWKDRAVSIAHEEQPGCYTSGDSYGYDGFDLCYNDWEGSFNRPNKTSKPAFIREYYDYEFGGHYSTTRVRRGDGDSSLMQNLWNLQWSHNRYRAYYPWTMGAAVWSMYDYNRGGSDNICYSGVADVFRLPKLSLPYFRMQTAAGTMLPSGPMPHELFIASHWMPESSDTVVVYGNVEEVELLLNGKSIARRSGDSGPTTDYVTRPDGGNATNLAFPPFTFTGVTWQSGLLEAVGYCQGKEVARCSVRTPEAAQDISISYFESGRRAGREDVLIVYVAVRDAHGTLCFGDNSSVVTLRVERGGTLLSPPAVEVEAGIASFIVSTDDARQLRVSAAATTAVGRRMAASRKIRLE